MTRPVPVSFLGDRYSAFASDILNQYLPSDSFEELISGHRLYLDKLELDQNGELIAVISNALARFELIIKFWNRQPSEGELEYFSFSDLVNQEEFHLPLIQYINETLNNYVNDPQLKLIAEIDNVAVIDLFSQVKQHRFNLSQVS